MEAVHLFSYKTLSKDEILSLHSLLDIMRSTFTRDWFIFFIYEQKYIIHQN